MKTRTRPRRPTWLALAAALVLLLATGCATTTRTATSTSGSASDDRPLEACESSDECGGDEYCRFALGACGGTGSCEPVPQVCTKEFNPVCACDQNTYSNACGAASEGLSLLKSGRCGTD